MTVERVDERDAEQLGVVPGSREGGRPPLEVVRANVVTRTADDIFRGIVRLERFRNPNDQMPNSLFIEGESGALNEYVHAILPVEGRIGGDIVLVDQPQLKALWDEYMVNKELQRRKKLADEPRIKGRLAAARWVFGETGYLVGIRSKGSLVPIKDI